jgi:oligosaccharide repeat unit polymerase
MIGAVLFFCWGSLCAVAVRTNRDLLSPAKFYLLVSGVFFGAIFVQPQIDLVYWTYAAILAIAGVAVLLEACYRLPTPPRSGLRYVITPAGMRTAVLAIWIVSLVPILSQLYLVMYFGGIAHYVASINLRVLAWRELGVFRAAVGSITVIHLVYLTIALRSTRFGVVNWFLLGVHFLIVVVFGAFSGSRSSLLWTFVLMAVVYHFIRKPIRMGFVVVMMAMILPLAAVMSVARGGVSWSAEEGLKTGLSRGEWSFNSSEDYMAYGVIPLRLIFSREPPPPQFGLTFASGVTTLVPRKIWPGKPEPGGVIFTREYAGDRWRGFSGLSAGIVGESVLNFGWFGVPVSFLIMLGVVFANYSIYRRLNAQAPESRKHTFLVMVYAVIVPMLCMLLYLDFSTAAVSMITRMVVLGLLYMVLVNRVLMPVPVATSTLRVG